MKFLNYKQKRAEKNNSGFALVETIMVLTLLALFGIVIFTLIVSGSKAQERVMAEKEAQSDARIAMSYINVRLRQSDAAGGVSVEKFDLTGQNALCVHDDEYGYDMWIAAVDNSLMEFVVDPGEQPADKDFGFEIVSSDSLSVSFSQDGSRITSVVSYMLNGKEQELTNNISLRSE